MPSARKSAQPRIALNLGIDPDLKVRLRRAAQNAAVPEATVVRAALEAFLQTKAAR